MTFVRFLLNLLYALPILGALALVAGMNVRRVSRVRQTPLPAVAVVYSVVVLVVLYRFTDAVNAFFVAVWELLPGAVGSPGLTWLYIWANVLVLFGFAVIKLVLRPLLGRWFDAGGELAQTIAARIYFLVPTYGLWFVERRFGDLRALLRAFYWTSAVLTLLLVAFAATFSDLPAFSAVAYPAIAALLIGEAYFAIDGLTKDEYDTQILGEADRSRRVGNYGPLARLYRDMFPERILADGVHLSSLAPLESGFKVGELARSDDEVERIAGAYFDRLGAERSDVDVNLVEATVGLLRGESVLISNPFYADLTPYLALPAYHRLLQYQKVLVVVGRDASTSDLSEWIRSGLESITGVPDLWNVGVLSSLETEGLDVGVLRFADVHDLDLLRRNDEFLRQVGYVILAEPSRMMSTGQLGLSLVVSRCSKDRTPAFAAFDGNHDGLVDALSHLLKVSLTEVVASALPRGASSEVVWKAEGPHLQTSLVPRVSRYLGMGTEIGALALKYQVKRVHWVGSESFPVADMMWIAGQYYGQINSFADLDLSQDALRDSLVAETNPWALPQQDNYFLVVEDEAANAFEAIRSFATRATSVGFVNVISEDYLLRDYMADNRELFGADPKAIPSIVPDFARTERNAVLRLIMSLLSFGMTRRELEHEFEVISRSGAGASAADGSEASQGEDELLVELRRLVAEHTGVTSFEINQATTLELSAVTSEDGLTTSYSIPAGSELDGVIAALRGAYFFVEDEVEDVNRIGALLYDHVYQALLPGQFITHGGKFYEVQSISPAGSRNGVILRRAADHIRGRSAYRQIRRFVIEPGEADDISNARTRRGGVEVLRARGTIRAESLGYLEMRSRSDLTGARRVDISGIPQRHYVNKSFLVLRLPGIPDHARLAVAMLLNELFVTVFPHSHHYVSALTPDETGHFGDLLADLTVADGLPEEGRWNDAIFIVEDSTIDLGLLVAVERHWERLLRTITDYLVWNSTPRPPEEEAPADFTPEFPVRPPSVKARSWWRRLWARLRPRRRGTAEPVKAEPAADTEGQSAAEQDPGEEVLAQEEPVEGGADGAVEKE